MGCVFMFGVFLLIGPWNSITEFIQPNIFLLAELSSSLKPATSGIWNWIIIYVKSETEYSDMNLLTEAFHLFSRIVGFCLSEG